MASDVGVGDIIRCTQIMTFAGSDEFQSVWYFQHQGSGTVTALVCMAGLEGEIAGWMGFITTDQRNALVYDGVDFYNVTQDEPMGFVADSQGNVGQNANQTLPLQCNALILFDGGVKKSLGKKYLPAYTETANDGEGQITVLALGNLVTFSAAVMSGVTVGGESFQCGHYRKVPDDFITWLTAKIDPQFRTQRRRVLGVGI